MARTNWRKLAKNIPGKVLVSPGVSYDVVFQKDIEDTKGTHLCGITDLDNKVITIRMGMKPKLTVETFVHEMYHAWSEEFKLNLTENQVLGLEKTIPYWESLFNKGK